MIITKISDGFGNQLFMYACGYAAAKRLCTRLLLDLSYLDTNGLRNYELGQLNIQYDKSFATSIMRFYPLKVLYRKFVHGLMKINFSMFKESTPYIYDSNIEQIHDNTYLFGYWQSERYFKEYRNDMIVMTTPKFQISDGASEYINQVKNCCSVAIHVRRGDYVNLGLGLNKQYYISALSLMKENVSNPIFFVFSDDIEYAKQLFSDSEGQFVYITYKSTNSTLEDFFIMKECKHIILANSSFSWWAAWLNDNKEKIVVRPKEFQESTDFYPDSWMKV